MAKPRLNITFPVLNEEAQLASSVERTIAFCAANGIDVYEFCIADNGSTDRTGEIARGLAARHARVKLVQLDRLRVGGQRLSLRELADQLGHAGRTIIKGMSSGLQGGR